MFLYLKYVDASVGMCFIDIFFILNICLVALEMQGPF